MAEAIVTGLTEDVIKKLFSMACEKIVFIMNTKSHMEKLQNLKSLLEVLLKDHDPFERSSNIQGQKLEKLRDVKDMLDILLDKRATIAEQKRVMGSRRFANVGSLILTPKKLLSPFRFAREYNKIMEQIESIKYDFGPIGNLAIEPSPRNQNQRCSPYVGVGPLLTEVVIGRDSDRDKILPLLYDSNGQDQSVSATAIIGIGGQGKTTLAKYLYNDERVRGCFDALLWVSCNAYSSFSDIVGKIAKYATNMKPVSCGSAQLYPEFFHGKSAYEGKRCFIVLDNVWYQNNLRAGWVDLKISLRAKGCLGASGSMVLITTRNEKVARIMDVPTPYKLNDLAESDSLALLQQYAQVKGQDPGVEAIGKEIVKLLPKVPIVLKNIGCQLAQKQSIREWKAFKDKVASTSSLQVGDDKVLEALKLSYDELDEKLKLCATYCSVFPRRTFYINKMILYWMALGFVGSEADGEECILKLVNYGFFKQQELDDITKFTIHDVMYDLITWIGTSKHQRINDKTKEITKGVRHVSLDIRRHPNWDFLLSELKGGERQLQSIVAIDPSYDTQGCISISNIEYIISKFLNLRVLELIDEGIKKVPTSIGELIHLRSLDLSGNPFCKLPNEITKLVNLLSLNLSRCDNLQHLPRETGNLVNLLSLDVSFCSDLEELPSDIGKLLKLRDLQVKGCNLRYMPKGIGNLTKLQSLDEFVVGEKRISSRGSKSKVEAAKLEELGHLNNLKGELDIIVRRQSKDIVLEARKAHLKKTQLRELRVIFEMRGEENEMFLEGLQPSGDQLSLLLIQNYGGKRLPTWITDDGLHQRFPKLMEMLLLCCEMKNPIGRREFQLDIINKSPIDFWPYWLLFKVDSGEDDMLDQWVPEYSRLRQQLEMGLVKMEFFLDVTNNDFSNLATAQITSLSIKKKLVAGSRSGRQQVDVLPKTCFSYVEKLILKDIPELEVIPEEFRDFSDLQRLKIKKCPKLKGLPDWIGSLSYLENIKIDNVPEMKALPDSIGSLTSLYSLVIRECPGLESLPHQISDLPETCYLEITGCSIALFEKCTGEYWPNLEHLHRLCIKSCEGHEFIIGARGDHESDMFVNSSSLDQLFQAQLGLESFTRQVELFQAQFEKLVNGLD